MIRLAAALLCDSANVRDNLLGVLGGGITNIGRPDFPAPINCDLALSFYAKPKETTEQGHLIEVSLLSEDDAELYVFDTAFELRPLEETTTSESVSIPLVVSLASAGVPSPGYYHIDVKADGELLASVPFRVEKID